MGSSYADLNNPLVGKNKRTAICAHPRPGQYGFRVVKEMGRFHQWGCIPPT